MGYNNDGASRIVIDIECVGSPDAATFLDPVKPPANYKDPEKIKAYCAEEFDKRVASAALEADLCEIVATGWMHDGDTCAVVSTREDMNEVDLLRELWHHIGTSAIIGYNALGYDLPVLIRRSQLLGVMYPTLNLDRYRTPHIDLMQRLTFNGLLTYRSLAFYCRRFNVPCEDTTKGSDVAQLVAAGDWAAVAGHCRSDVEKTAALARRLGWLPQLVEAEAVL